MSSKRFIADLVFRSDPVDCIGVRMAIIEFARRVLYSESRFGGMLVVLWWYCDDNYEAPSSLFGSSGYSASVTV
jgi:hypothetical protein